MRIGILTLPLHTNYGGILQAYALQTVLERMGNDVVVFDTPNKCILPPFWKLPLCYMKRFVLKQQGKINRIFIEQHKNRTIPIIAQNIKPFIDKYINRKEVDTLLALKEHDYDAIVVGSDQVWRPIYFKRWHSPIECAFLSFAKTWDVKRIVYAASFGTDDWEYTDEQTQKCKKLLQLFDAVSVREANGLKLCKKYFAVDALHVLDPTMLLDKEDYITLFKNARTLKSQGTLLKYVLDETPDLQKLIAEFAKQKKLLPFSVNNPYEYDDTRPLQERIKPSVESWLRGFYDAEFVITDSFHACVFSIIFKKQFLVVGNKERGMSRFESLLKVFNLQDRLVNEGIDIYSLPCINYDEVYKHYDTLKNLSFSFLKKNINCADYE